MMLTRLTDKAKNVILNSLGEKGTEDTTIRKLILNIEESGGVATLLLKTHPKLRLSSTKKVDLKKLIERAYYYSAELEHRYVGTEHLLLALLYINTPAELEVAKEQLLKLNIFPAAAGFGNLLEKTPITDSFGTNLNTKHQRFAMFKPEYRQEVEDLISILLQKENPNPLIIGETGVGKNTLVDILVHRLNSMEVPVALAGYQVIELDVMSFIASISGREGVESGIASFLEELDLIGDVILYIKDFQNMFVGTNVGFAVPLAFSMLKSSLMSSGVSVIAVISNSFYEKISGEEGTQLLKSFEELQVEEPDAKKTKEILKNKSNELSRFHDVKISNDILKYVYEIAAEKDLKGSTLPAQAGASGYGVKFPQKGILLLDKACSILLLKRDKVPADYKKLVEKKTALNTTMLEKLDNGNFKGAAQARAKIAKIDLKIEAAKANFLQNSSLILTKSYVDEAARDFGKEEVSKTSVDLKHLSNLAKKIKEKIIGQDQAVDIVSKALIRSKLGLRARKRPLGNFLFLGPTGVGKTELTKVLADAAFGEDSLIRLDMSDFGEKHNVARLVGAPPGYVGYGEGGELTSRIENKPESVVLFDEIEKAHPDVLNILLQIMEEGELIDAKGQAFDFSKAVVALTSNLGTELVLKDGIGFSNKNKSDEKIEKRLKENLKKILKPELINRFDEIVVFKKLSSGARKDILELLLEEVSDNLKKQKVSLKVYSGVKKHLLRLGYSPEYGARALRRTIETELLDKIAEVLLKTPARPLNLKAKFISSEIVIEKQHNL